MSNLESEVTETYFGDVLQSWNNGCQLDLRVKLAIEFLKSGQLPEVVGQLRPIPADEDFSVTLAKFSLDLADSLIAESTARGLINDLPEDDELTQSMRRHIRRSVRAQMYQQVAAQKIGPEEAPAVQVGNGRLPIHQ